VRTVDEILAALRRVSAERGLPVRDDDLRRLAENKVALADRRGNRHVCPDMPTDKTLLDWIRRGPLSR
jgi:hypothetical protein